MAIIPVTIRPFEPSEKRILKLDKSKLDPKCLISGKAPSIEASHARTDSHAWGDSRHYNLENKSAIKSSAIRVQLNHGNPKDDESRLKSIMEDSLAPEIAEIEKPEPVVIK